MNLGEFRERTKSFKDDYEVVVSGIGDGEDISVSGVISYSKEDTNKMHCLIMKDSKKQTFKELLYIVKELFLDWFENNVNEDIRNEVYFWVSPIGPLNAFDINLRAMAGQVVWHRIAWYNLNLLLFKIRGEFKLLNKDMQSYYDALKEYETGEE